MIPIGNWPSSAGIRGGNLTLGTGAANPLLALSGWRRQKESRMTRARQPVSAPSTGMLRIGQSEGADIATWYAQPGEISLVCAQ